MWLQVMLSTCAWGKYRRIYYADAALASKKCLTFAVESHAEKGGTTVFLYNIKVIKILYIKMREYRDGIETRPGWGEAQCMRIGITEGF